MVSSEIDTNGQRCQAYPRRVISTILRNTELMICIVFFLSECDGLDRALRPCIMLLSTPSSTPCLHHSCHVVVVRRFDGRDHGDSVLAAHQRGQCRTSPARLKHQAFVLLYSLIEGCHEASELHENKPVLAVHGRHVSSYPW